MKGTCSEFTVGCLMWSRLSLNLCIWLYIIASLTVGFWINIQWHVTYSSLLTLDGEPSHVASEVELCKLRFFFHHQSLSLPHKDKKSNRLLFDVWRWDVTVSVSHEREDSWCSQVWHNHISRGQCDNVRTSFSAEPQTYLARHHVGTSGVSGVSGVSAGGLLLPSHHRQERLHGGEPGQGPGDTQHRQLHSHQGRHSTRR